MSKAHTELDQSHLHREPFQAYWAVARGDLEWIDIPVLTEAIPGLWVGGAPEPRVPDGFDFVVNLFSPWASYEANGAEVREVPGIDDGDLDESLSGLFMDLAREVSSRVSEGQTVLVHCQAGLNRSATAVALALMLRGASASEAIRLLRERRHRLVLCNPNFEQWLLSLDMDREVAGGSPPDRLVESANTIEKERASDG